MRTPLLTLPFLLLAALPLQGAEIISSITVPGDVEVHPTDGYIVDDEIPVVSITTASGTFSNLIGPTEIFHAAGTISFATRGVGLSGPSPFPSPLSDSLLGNNLANTLVHGNSGTLTFNVLFGQTVFDSNAGADNQLEVFYLDLIPANEPYSLQAIVGGTADTPILGGSVLVFSTVSYAPINGITPTTAHDAVLDRSGNTNSLNATYGGHGIDLSEFGVTSLVGLQWKSTAASSADPAAFLVSIPEPSSAAFLLGVLGVMGTMARNRRGSQVRA